MMDGLDVVGPRLGMRNQGAQFEFPVEFLAFTYAIFEGIFHPPLLLITINIIFQGSRVFYWLSLSAIFLNINNNRDIETSSTKEKKLLPTGIEPAFPWWKKKKSEEDLIPVAGIIVL